MFKSKLDEREKMEQYRAEHYAFWVMWWILAAALIYKGYILECPFSEIAWEMAALLAGGVVAIAFTTRRGLWDSRIKPSVKNYLWLSLVFTVLFTVVFGIGKYRNYPVYRENIKGLFIPTVLIFAASLFVLCFAALALTGSYAKKREKKLEEELEKEMDDED